MSKLTAILAWGSLICDPKSLDYNESLGWIYDGPILPVEFARISNDGRLTLVITENGTPNKTYYTFANIKLSFDEVIENLRIREGKCKKESIGFYNAKTDTFHPEDFKYKDEIRKWSNEKKIKNIVWTNLPEKWEYVNENNEILNINPDNRIEYLKNLSVEKSIAAENYIRKTPAEIQTEYRKQIEKELNWLPIIKENKKERFQDTSQLIYFSNISGFGTLTCLNCNAKDEMWFSNRKESSYQCQSCGNFKLLDFNFTITNCNCGGKLEKYKPVFCRCCDSFKLSYKVRLLT